MTQRDLFVNLMSNFKAMRDIFSRHDIETVIADFYEQVMADELIGHYFTKVAKIDLKTHLPAICDFWEMVVFNKSGYKKDILDTHLKLNELHHISVDDTNRWLSIFEETMDRHYAGPHADKMKLRAKSIAIVIMSKVLSS